MLLNSQRARETSAVHPPRTCRQAPGEARGLDRIGPSTAVGGSGRGVILKKKVPLIINLSAMFAAQQSHRLPKTIPTCC